MAAVVFFPLSLFLISCSLVVYGARLSRQTLATRYLTLMQHDLEASFRELSNADGIGVVSADVARQDDGATPLDERQVHVPLRRILQLGNFNPRVAFVVASQMARQGRLGMAARMMRDIAPRSPKEGFAQAHAWLAHYAMINWKGTEDQAEVLLGDLQAAEHGGVALTLGQVQNYASLLIQTQRTQDALAVLRDYAPRYAELNVLLATLSKQAGLTGVQYQGALAAGRQSFEDKQKAGELLPQDWLHAVQIEMLDGALDRALVLARTAFESDTQAPELRRLYSDVLLAKHHSLSADATSLNADATATEEASSGDFSLVAEPADTSAADSVVLPELRYLEAACQVDSSNPALASEVAKAVSLGRNLSPQLRAALERSLVDGTASGITHLILANKILTSSAPKSSLPHLRLALRQMPNSPVVMNNLAYALMKYEPSKLDEAQQLMERALSIPGGSVQDRASMFDTLGEIRQTQGETLAAIEMFEQAIALDGSKLGTRQRLVEAYQQAGMLDLAEAQRRRIAELERGDE